MSKVQLPPRNAIIVFAIVVALVIGVAVFLSYSLVDAAYVGALGRARAENAELRAEVKMLRYEENLNPQAPAAQQQSAQNTEAATDVTTLATQMLMGAGVCVENPGVFRNCYRVDAATGQVIVWQP